MAEEVKGRHKLIILGDGVAGLTAGVYAARADLAPLIITGYESGGQLMLTTLVENFPGFPDGVMGPELIERIRKQAEKFGASFLMTAAEKITGEEGAWRVHTPEGVYEAEAVIIATGASARMLGLEAEKEYMGRGISVCATCDGAFTRGKKVIVVGGGDSAMEDALFLTKFAEKVTIVHRRDQFRASKIMQKRVFDNPKINIIWNHIVTDIKGDGMKVTHAVLKNTQTGEEQTVETDFVFYAIGHVPNTSFVKDLVTLDEQGYIITDKYQMTSQKGIFAAGDVQDPLWRQAVTAAGTGAAAAISAERYLAEREHTKA